jgi:hypothetical protein
VLQQDIAVKVQELRPAPAQRKAHHHLPARPQGPGKLVDDHPRIGRVRQRQVRQGDVVTAIVHRKLRENRFGSHRDLARRDRVPRHLGPRQRRQGWRRLQRLDPAGVVQAVRQLQGQKPGGAPDL